MAQSTVPVPQLDCHFRFRLDFSFATQQLEKAAAKTNRGQAKGYV